MASGDYVDVAQVPVIEFQAGIPDDIFNAACAASKHESDGEDPFEPQPKRFMQTEHQKRQQKRDLEIRRVASIIRKIRKQYEAKRSRLARQKQLPSPFERMPSDLILKLMQHTTCWEDLGNLMNSCAVNRSIFKANKKAVFRGIEIEQFPEWAELFGDSNQRTPAQSQNLKDCIVSEGLIYNPGVGNLIYEDWLLELVRRVDNNEFTGVTNIRFLRSMQHRLDVDIKLTESFTGFKIARRTAICLRSLGYFRTEMVDEEIRSIEIPWEARSQRIREQQANIQAEIRSILKIVIEEVYYSVQGSVKKWILGSYHRNPGKHGNPQTIKKWISKLVTGLILEVVIPAWRADKRDSRPSFRFFWDDWSLRLEYELTEFFNWHDGGSVDVIQLLEDGVEFGTSIGLDLEMLLDGTRAGEYLDGIRSDGDGKVFLDGVVVEEADADL